jgi:hypothetical protein
MDDLILVAYNKLSTFLGRAFGRIFPLSASTAESLEVRISDVDHNPVKPASFLQFRSRIRIRFNQMKSETIGTFFQKISLHSFQIIGKLRHL